MIEHNMPLFEVIKNEPGSALRIKDIGHDKGYPTITNAVEPLVLYLIKSAFLIPGRRLFYVDSEGIMDEIVIKDGKFAYFSPLPQME